MTHVEPEKVRAIRTAVVLDLGLDPGEVEVQERTAPESSEDEPFYATIRIRRKEGFDDATINAAIRKVEGEAWQHPASPWQLRWQFKS